MGASRKLQGEIDRVLKKVQEGVDVFDSIWNKVYDTENVNQKEKFEADLKKEIKKLQRYRDQIKTWIQSSEIKDKKVSASYEQALMDARKQIEREMERFKICEKETKTKAFSKEGLGQQPKTDPKEKAKSEARDWLNNVVGELETQIESFEAEIEAVSVKKGKTRPPRLTHLETSIFRHKSHIMKLELILRLLDNDELSPDEVNDVKDFLDDYVERNQDDPDDFCDVDEFYNALPLEKVESLEDLVVGGSSSLVKGVGSVSIASAGLGLKGSVAGSATQGPVAPSSSSQQSSSARDQSEETASLDANSDVPKSSLKGGTVGSLISSSSSSSVSATTAAGRSVLENPVASVSLPSVTPSSSVKSDDNVSFLSHRSSPAPNEIAIGRGTGRGPVVGVAPNQVSISAPMSLGSVSAVTAASDVVKRNVSGSDEKNTTNAGEGAVIGGRIFSPSVVSGAQWRPPSLNSFQNQNEMGQFRGRTEITPDQREKFLQRFQHVQQQGPSNLLNAGHLSGANQKQFTGPQQGSLLQQFNSQSSSTQIGVGLGVQSPILGNVKSASQPPNVVHNQSTQQGSLTSGLKDSDLPHVKVEGQQQSDDFNAEPLTSSGPSKAAVNDDDLKSTYMALSSASVIENSQITRDSNLSPGQPLQSSTSLGVIGRRSVLDLGAIGDNINGSIGNAGAVHDDAYTSQMLEAAYYKLPQPKDSERVKNYIPRHPVVTPPTYPQVQAPIVDNPAFWERLGLDNMGNDTLFFAFYYQQNTYQQYLAARELKQQSWRYHRKYHTWFQRHEEPKITTDDYEKGTYVYFDFHISDDNLQHGWCQRIKTDFTFEYSYLEDELGV